MYSIIARMRLTTKIALLVIGAVAVSTIVVSVTIYMQTSGSVRQAAIEQQAVNLKMAATTLVAAAGGYLPGANIAWSEQGELAKISTLAMPQRFPSHELVDSIQRITGGTVSILAKGDNGLRRISTTLVDEDGLRMVDAVVDENSPAKTSIESGASYVGDDLINGQSHYASYQPITGQDGTTMGFLSVSSEKSVVEANIDELLLTMRLVGFGVLAVLGVVGFIVARVMMRPIPKLAATMRRVAEGEFATELPYLTQENEIGDMARAVEVFVENGLRVEALTKEERDASAKRRADRADMMIALQAAFGEVVDAAVSGDFSKRVHEAFDDDELNTLARSVNRLLETVQRGVAEAGTVMETLARADLTQRMTGTYGGAFAKLQNDTNRVAENLSDIVGKLRGTARSLRTATSEILSGANDLSDRTTRQAATLEESTAAIESLASTVSENAVKAEKACFTAVGVSRSAADSMSIISLANSAMARITDSSSKISNIIGMIDDIAFQTNLLALNASVEAARAGDAGKGFAVVAVEVRRLAQSAAAASADVKGLIEQSAAEVSEGNRFVSQATEQLSGMMAAVDANVELMNAINLASQQQAKSIEEVSIAMRTIDEMTQHNSALVEQTNAAIEQTEGQASDLDRLVAVFVTSDSNRADRKPVHQAA